MENVQIKRDLIDMSEYQTTVMCGSQLDPDSNNLKKSL